jgi:hypothetical protein
MNCLYITLFCNIVAGIVQTFIKSWNQLLYPRVIQVCASTLNHVMTSSCTSSSSSNFFPARCFFRWRNKWKCFSSSHNWAQKPDVHLLRWEIVWRNAPRIRWAFGSALSFQKRLNQTKPVLPLSNERGSHLKDQGRRQCWHNKHKHFPIFLHLMYLYLPDTPRTSNGLVRPWSWNIALRGPKGK